MIASARAPDPADIQAAREVYGRALARSPAPLRSSGLDLLSCLATSEWELEWNLPRWLNEPFGLSENVIRRLVLANVLGLGYVRLMDDCNDEAGDLQTLSDTRLLAEILYEAAISEFRSLLGQHAWFWEQVERFLGLWRAAASGARAFDVLHATAEEIQPLADHGAPLLICAAAVCALSERQSRLSAVAEPIRHYLIASVVLDHMADWREDLQAGRPNLLVTSLLHGQPPSRETSKTTLRVYQAFLETQAILDYLSLAVRHFDRAASSSRSLGFPGLEGYLHMRARSTTREADGWARALRSTLSEAAELFFPQSAV